jgi:hypothetical protein
MLGRNDHARVFNRVVKIVAGHEGRKLWCPLFFSKDTDKQYSVRREDYNRGYLLFRLRMFATGLLLWLKQREIFAVAFFL